MVKILLSHYTEDIIVRNCIGGIIFYNINIDIFYKRTMLS